MENKAETKELSLAKQFENSLTLYKGTLKDLLNFYGISADKFVVTTINSVKRIPKLLECDRATLFGAILQSAELGLMPNTPMGLAFIIPYKKKYKEGNIWKEKLEAQFQIGYQGYLELMHRNPKVLKVTSDIVYENDHFKSVGGLNPLLEHTPSDDRTKRGERKAVYAIAWIKDSPSPEYVVLYKEDIEQFKKISQSGDSEYSPWNSDKDPMGWMWKKTALKQLSKIIPKTEESGIAKANYVDSIIETGGKLEADEEGNITIIENEEQKQAMKSEAKAAKTSQAVDEFKTVLFDEPKKESKKSYPTQE